MRRLNCHPLCRVLGLYVTDLPAGVKVGRSKDLHARLLAHRSSGATRAWVFHNLDPGPFPFPRTLVEFERTALHLVTIYGGRPTPGTTETFTGITYDDAVRAVDDFCALRGASKVAVDVRNLDTSSCLAADRRNRAVA